MYDANLTVSTNVYPFSFTDEANCKLCAISSESGIVYEVSSVSATNVYTSNATVSFTSSWDRSSVKPPVATLRWWSVILSAFQWLVFALGVSGNLLVLCVMAWRRYKSQFVTQLFIGSLSASGLGQMFSLTWILALLSIENNWRFGLLCCRLQYFGQTNTMNVSIWTLAALAVER
jgi:hypothetical protein